VSPRGIGNGALELLVLFRQKYGLMDMVRKFVNAVVPFAQGIYLSLGFVGVGSHRN
jgi:hypothetical protein